jgi:hypothetical protein
MTARPYLQGVTLALLTVAAFVSLGDTGAAQGQPAAPSAPAREAARLDGEGATPKARVIWQALIDSAADPAAKARAERSMAMSYAFDGDCANTVKYETMVIAYWGTRQQAEPQNAFFQEGEIADEAARVCLDAGDLSAAEQWYRKGYQFGTLEPAPPTHPRSLWVYRLAHALGRLAARRGDTLEARVRSPWRGARWTAIRRWHNPPAAFVRPFVRKKLGLAGSPGNP